MIITSVEAVFNFTNPTHNHARSHSTCLLKSCHVPSERSVARPLQSSASESDDCPLQRGNTSTVPFSIQIMNDYQLISLASRFLACGDPVTSIHVHAQKTCKFNIPLLTEKSTADSMKIYLTHNPSDGISDCQDDSIQQIATQLISRC